MSRAGKLVSVIVPVYNVENYLDKCIESLIKQKYDNIEIILVDDGSTDRCGSICDKAAEFDSRIKVLHQKNKGLSEARNVGIKCARGEYICFVDSDDYVEESFIERMIEAVEDGIDVVVCGFNESYPENKIISGEEATIKLLIQQDNMDIVAWNKMYKKILFRNIQFPVGKKYEDNLTTYKLLSKAKAVSYIAKPLYHYIERTGSITSIDNKEERLTAREDAAIQSIEYFNNNNKLKAASEISLLTAKLAFIDAALNKTIEKKYYSENRDWILRNKTAFLNNRFLTTKLKVYIVLLSYFNGMGYRILRKFRHE